MSSAKKASDGISLLSMYGDEDEDDEMEEDLTLREDEIAPPSISDANDDIMDDGREITPQLQEERGTSSANATPHPPLFSPQQQQQQQQQTVHSELIYVQTRKSRLTIVDYGHEEGAMTPEAEEGEIMATATGRVMYGDQLQSSDGEIGEKKLPGISRLPTPNTHLTPPQTSDPIDQLESETMNDYRNESETAENEDATMIPVEEQKDADPLEKFLPPPPKAKCSEELQEKIIKFLALKRTSGRSFNSEVRNKKEYRNPDFLLYAVTRQNIDQIGSCLSKEVFDPHGYDKSDFYDEIEADMRREMERREQERKKGQKLDFVSVGMQPSNVAPTPKISIPTPGGVSSITVTTSTLDVRESRQNKKSKWDKVDTAQENLSAVGAHAVMLAAAKAGSGYSAFAQQRRKEAEDRRSSDRKLDRRS